MFYLYSGGFTPRSIPGCILWLRSDLGVTLNGGNVAAWADQSGSGHHVTQGVAGKQPLFNAGAGPLGRPSVQGVIANSTRLVASWAQAQPTTTFLVHSGAALAANETLVDGGGGAVNTLRLYGDGLGAMKFFCGGVDVTKAWVAGWHVRTLVANGASSAHVVDGGAPVTGNGGAAASGGICLFSAGDDRFYSDDAVVEVIQYAGALSSISQTQVVHYLGARYGITVT